MKKYIKRTFQILLVALVIWILGLNFTRWFTPWGFIITQYNDRLEPVEIDLSTGGTKFVYGLFGRFGKKYREFDPDPQGVGTHIKFKVPEAYLIISSKVKGKSVNKFEMEVTYPGFKPWAYELLHAETLPREDMKMKITINKGKDFSVKEVHHANKNIGTVYVGQVYGLKHYRFKEELKDDGTPGPSNIYGFDFFYSPEDSFPAMAIDCPSDLEVRDVWCTMTTDISRDIWIEYWFKRKYLENWEKIDNDVREFINSLIIKEPNKQ